MAEFCLVCGAYWECSHKVAEDVEHFAQGPEVTIEEDGPFIRARITTAPSSDWTQNNAGGLFGWDFSGDDT